MLERQMPLTNLLEIMFASKGKPNKPETALLFIDEIQNSPQTIARLRYFYEEHPELCVIAAGSLLENVMDINASFPVGRVDYMAMHPCSFREFLTALGKEHLHYFIDHPDYSDAVHDEMMALFSQYVVIGGMPEIVKLFVNQKNYSGTLAVQKQIILDYEEDITKYAEGLDKTKILNVFRKIPVFLGQDNKKFRISKVAHGARNREYSGVTDWLIDAGIVNVSYCLNDLALPLKGNYDPDNYRMYFMDTGLLVASLDEESSKDLRDNKNFNTYKGAIYENIVADMLKKSGYDLYFYKNEEATLEVEFFVRDANNLIPIDVKATDGKLKSVKSLINDEKRNDIKFGIKLAEKNIGFENNIYTFPYFLTFLLKRFLTEKK